MSSHAAPHAHGDAAPAKGGGKKLVFVVICLVCIVAGGAIPMFVDVKSALGGTTDEKASKEKAKPKATAHGGHAEEKTITIPFGDAAVNLAEERMNRYLRMKIVLVCDEEMEKEATLRVTKHKSALKSWIIGHVAGKTLKDIGGTVGVRRLQREMLEKFEEVLFPEGGKHLKDVLFEEYIIQ